MRLSFAAALLAALMSPAALAQYTTPDTPADSPLWWPVFDGISEEDLRLGSQRDAIEEHYRAAVEAGTAPDCGPDYVPDMFVDTGAHPELVPIWYVLNMEVVSLWNLEESPARDLSLVLKRSLRESGMSDEGTVALRSSVREMAEEIRRRWDRLNADLEPMAAAVASFADQHVPVTGSGTLHGIVAKTRAEAFLTSEESLTLERLKRIDEIGSDHADPLALSEFLDGSYADWSQWIATMNVQPEEEVMTLLLPGLREALSSEDWRSLRRYLGSRIGRGQTGIYSGVHCPDAPHFLGRIPETGGLP